MWQVGVTVCAFIPCDAYMQSKSLKNVLLHVSFGRSLFAFLLSVPKTIASESKHKIVQSAEYTDAQVHVGDKRWQQICILFPHFWLATCTNPTRVTRLYFTSQHKTCKTKTKSRACNRSTYVQRWQYIWTVIAVSVFQFCHFCLR